MPSLFSRRVLKPEGSIVAGLAVMGAVFANYQLHVGSVSEAHASRDNHPALETSRKKAGYESLILVAGIGLIARDSNIIILGGATIIAMELSYRHGIMAHPESGQMMRPNPSDYLPAENNVVVQMPSTGTEGY